MQQDDWTNWPSKEALNREGLAPAQRRLGVLGRLVGLGFAVWGTFVDNRNLHGWAVWVVAGVTLYGVIAFLGFLRSTPRTRVVPSLIWLGMVLSASLLAMELGGHVIGVVLLCAISLSSVQRLPLAVAFPATAISMVLFFALVPYNGWLGDAGLVLGLGALGYIGRLDWAARAGTLQLLEQERAARAAEAESAALAERARIAREIHDVLAHSLSAQLVHLEAARLMLDAGADREQLRERIVAARRMAQDGLAETRAALSALRGEFVPTGEFLTALAANDGAQVVIEGEVRPLSAEAGVAVRRTAQEALTNIRKHAPGADCTIRLTYLEHSVELDVWNGASSEGGGALSASGSGYGLLGMRERAELLGGSLVAGPEAEGFRVRLSVPTG